MIRVTAVHYWGLAEQRTPIPINPASDIVTFSGLPRPIVFKFGTPMSAHCGQCVPVPCVHLKKSSCRPITQKVELPDPPIGTEFHLYTEKLRVQFAKFLSSTPNGGFVYGDWE